MRMILATTTSGLPAYLNQTGFYPEQNPVAILEKAGIWIGPRSYLEEMPEFRQVIPYILFRQGDKYLRYTRTFKGGENRLHDKLSVGVGGHIDILDITTVGDGVDLYATLYRAALRELFEQIGVVPSVRPEWMGLLVDNESPVGLVHIGILSICDIAELPRQARDPALTDVRMCTKEELMERECFDRLELWSQILVKGL